MKRIILILLAAVLLVSCGKKAEELDESEPTPSESETMPTESETAPSDSESDTVQATELDHHIEMYDENDVVYAKELTPVKRVENPTYRIEGYYSTPSEAFAGYPIVHGYGYLAEKPWNADTGGYICHNIADVLGEIKYEEFYGDYYIDNNGVVTGTNITYIDYLSPDSVVFKDEVKIPSAFVYESDETVGVLVELLAETNGENTDTIDYYFTKVFAYGKLIDISEYLVNFSYTMMKGFCLKFQGDSVYVEVCNGRLKITEDDVSFTEGLWDYFYDETGAERAVYDEYGQEIWWGFHPGKFSKDSEYPSEIILPYWN